MQWNTGNFKGSGVFKQNYPTVQFSWRILFLYIVEFHMATIILKSFELLSEV